MELNDDIIKIIFDFADIKCNYCKKIFSINYYKINYNIQLLNNQKYCTYDCYRKKYVEYQQYL